MIITRNIANVLSLCFYGVDPLEHVPVGYCRGRKTTVANYVHLGAIEQDGRTLTNTGLAILQEYISCKHQKS